MTSEIFLVARLFADQHDWRVQWAFAEHGLGGVFPQVAGAAVGCFLAQGGKAGGWDARGWCHGGFPVSVGQYHCRLLPPNMELHREVPATCWDYK
jgi:hypothetical protein